jgi:hypothetical protein
MKGSASAPSSATTRERAGSWARDKGDIAREPIELGDEDAAFRGARKGQGRGELRPPSASLPLPVSISTCSAMMSTPSASAKRATAVR